MSVVGGTGSTITFSATTVTDTELFLLTPSDGGYVSLEDGYDTYAALAETDHFSNTTQFDISAVITSPSYNQFDPSDFITRLASLLCVDISRVRLLNMSSYDGVSTLVTIAITDNVNAVATTAASLSVTFQQIAVYSPSTFEYIGYTVDPLSVYITIVDLDSSSGIPITTGNTATGAGASTTAGTAATGAGVSTTTVTGASKVNGSEKNAATILLYVLVFTLIVVLL